VTEKLYAGLAFATADTTVDLAALDSSGTLVASGRAGSDEEVDAWLAALPGSLVVVAVDAPLVGPEAAHAGSRAAALALRSGWSVAPTHRGSVGWPVCVHVAADGAQACARLARIWHEEPGALAVLPSLEQWEDGYVVAEPAADVPASEELANYRDYLTHYRRTLARKCEGLEPADLARRSVPPSTLSLLGLVRHMAYVEQAWFQRAPSPTPQTATSTSTRRSAPRSASTRRSPSGSARSPAPTRGSTGSRTPPWRRRSSTTATERPVRCATSWST
jgi:hypothetical protein